jgi:peptidoglycan/LPS O-acetylase OafA/YrhL
MLVPTSLGLRLFIYLRWPDNELAQYVLLPCHMEGLAIGALIAIRYRSGPWKINHALLTIAAALLALATIAVGREGGWERFGVPIRTLGFLVSSVASAAVVVWLIEFRYSRIVAPLSWRPIQYLGKISYGIYLVHFPVLALIIHFMPDINHGLRGVAFSGTVLATSILIAAISWRFMEEPLLRLKNRVARVA